MINILLKDFLNKYCMKIKFYLSVSTLLIILLVCNGNIFMVNNNLSDNLLLANIDALAFIEGEVEVK